MRFAGRSVFDRPSGRSSLPEASHTPSHEPSTSYSTHEIGLQGKTFRPYAHGRDHNMTFLMDRQTHSAALNKAGALNKRQHPNAVCAMGSMTLSLSDKLQYKHTQRRKKARHQVSFEVSDLQLSAPINHHGILHSQASTAVTQQSCGSGSYQPVSLDSFRLPARHQQPLFASLSSVHGCKGPKQKPVRVQSDTAASPTLHQPNMRNTKQLIPAMQLAQSSATALDAPAKNHEVQDAGGLDIASAGHRLKRYAVRAPRQIRRLFAGAFAGALSKTTIAPIETIRMQVMGGKGTVMETIARTWGRRGVLGFFSGNSADILRVMPSKAIELAAFDAYKKLLSHEDANGKVMRPGPLFTGLAGAAAGATSTVGLYPLETLRTRLAMGDYKNMLHAVRVISAEEGFMAFYQGIQASLIGILPYAGIRLAVYDGLKWSHRNYTKKEHIPPVPTMLYGAFAGLVSASATFPVEVVRRRMMVGTAKGGTWAALTSIAQQEGWRSLYKGIGLTWVKQAPQYAVTFLAYDKLKELLEV